MWAEDAGGRLPHEEAGYPGLSGRYLWREGLVLSDHAAEGVRQADRYGAVQFRGQGLDGSGGLDRDPPFVGRHLAHARRALAHESGEGCEAAARAVEG